jgi:hypothetical protein
MSRRREIFIYLLGVLAGLAAGTIEITINDLLVTAIFVMMVTMVLGYMRPRHAWRWTLIVAVFVPVFRVAAYAVLNQHSNRAQIWESALGLLTGTVGAYAGTLGRLGVDQLFRAPEKVIHHRDTEAQRKANH